MNNNDQFWLEKWRLDSFFISFLPATAATVVGFSLSVNRIFGALLLSLYSKGKRLALVPVSDFCEWCFCSYWVSAPGFILVFVIWYLVPSVFLTLSGRLGNKCVCRPESIICLEMGLANNLLAGKKLWLIQSNVDCTSQFDLKSLESKFTSRFCCCCCFCTLFALRVDAALQIEHCDHYACCALTKNRSIFRSSFPSVINHTSYITIIDKVNCFYSL